MVGQSVCVSHCALLCTLELISDHGAMREWPWILNVLYVCRISRANWVLGKLLTLFMRQFNFKEVSRLNWHANCILRKKFDTFNAPIYWRRSAYSQTWSINVYGSHLSSNLITTSKIDSVILHFNCSITCSTHLKSYSTSMGRMVSNKKWLIHSYFRSFKWEGLPTCHLWPCLPLSSNRWQS